MAGQYYLWRVPEKLVEVEISVTVVQRMHSLIVHSQLHGEEGVAFGMLLGQTRKVRGGRHVTVIHDFEPLNVARLRERPAAPQGCGYRVVGLYHSRPGSGSEVRLDHVDASLITSSFTEPGMVYLLIQAEAGKASEAGFFIQEAGDVHGYQSYLTFPFHAELLRAAGNLVQHEPEPRRLGWAAGAAIAGLALVGGGALMWKPAPQSAAASPAPIVQQETPSPAATSVTPPRGTAVRPATGVRKQKSRHRSRAKSRKRAENASAPKKDVAQHLSAAQDSDLRPNGGRFRRFVARLARFRSAGR